MARSSGSIIYELARLQVDTERRAHYALEDAQGAASEERARAAAAIEEIETLAMEEEKGIIPDVARALVRDLISLGVTVGSVQDVIGTVAKANGTAVEGSISTRSTGRIMGEAYLASKMQIVEEVRNASDVTISSDGTTHWHIQYDGRNLVVTSGDSHVRRTMGVSSASNYTSDTQLAGWRGQVGSMYEIYNTSPRGKATPADPRDFSTKIHGCMTDHAEDQKKLVRGVQAWKTEDDRTMRGEEAYDQTIRGEQAPSDVPIAELVLMIADTTASAIEEAGGSDAWRLLSVEARDAREAEIKKQVVKKLGEQVYEALPSDERAVVDLFIHGGCTVHKELNAIKGGMTRLTQFWTSAGLTPPVLLMNRDNAAAASAGSSNALARAVEVSCGGAIKLTDLAGALFRNKDDKKGQQDSFRYFMESRLGRLLTFPNTSNTRFGSNGDAATFLLLYRTLILEYLEQVRDKKGNGQWTNLEANIYRGLTDLPTLTELAILSLYSQAISHPYMCTVRGPDCPSLLELKPLHDRVQGHLRKLIADPELLIGPGASHVTGNLFGKDWDKPTVLDVVHELLPTMPHIRAALIAFCQGALETWTRFCREFAPNGPIAGLSSTMHARTYMPATNDWNEGEVGSWRQNATGTYIENLDPIDRQWLRGAHHDYNAKGVAPERRRQIAEAESATASGNCIRQAANAARKMARLKTLVETNLIEDPDLPYNTTVKVICHQLAWHRRSVDTDDQKSIKHLHGKKELIYPELVAGIRRWQSSPDLQNRAREELEKAQLALSNGSVGVVAGDAAGDEMSEIEPDEE
ncbi:hypothetical protein C8Q80DRAFT_1220070 [Daedaleopsis nitida]|nr:hypothetical protein C8Q80DRAFT_1220070 [Daedaleopsis nitida]